MIRIALVARPRRARARSPRCKTQGRPAGRVPAVDAARGALPEGREVLRGAREASSASRASRSPPTTTTRSRSRRSRTCSTQGAKVLVIQPTDSQAASRVRAARARARREGRRVRPRDRRRPTSTTTSRTTATRSACCRREAALAGDATARASTCILVGPGRSLGRDRDHARLRGHARAVHRAGRHRDRDEAEPQRVVARAGAAHRRGCARPAPATTSTRSSRTTPGMARGAVQAVAGRRPRARVHRRRRRRRRERQLRVPGQAVDRGPQGHRSRSRRPPPTSRSELLDGDAADGAATIAHRRQARAGRRRARRGRHARHRQAAARRHRLPHRRRAAGVQEPARGR